MSKEHTATVAKVLDQMGIIVGANEDHDCIRPDELELGANSDEAPICGPRTLDLLQRWAIRLADSIYQTSAYVTRPHGAVGGGS